MAELWTSSWLRSGVIDSRAGRRVPTVLMLCHQSMQRTCAASVEAGFTVRRRRLVAVQGERVETSCPWFRGRTGGVGHQALYVQGRGHLRADLHQHLLTGPAVPRHRGSSVTKRGKITKMILINERLAEVTDRAVPSHASSQTTTMSTPFGGSSTSVVPSASQRTPKDCPANRNPRTVIGPYAAGRAGRRVSRPAGASGSNPRATEMSTAADAADHACGCLLYTSPSP